MPNPIACLRDWCARKQANCHTAFLVVVTVAINLLVLMLAGLFLYQSHQQHEERATITSRDLSLLLQQELSSEIGKAELALLAIVDEYGRQVSGKRIDNHAMNAFINRLHARLPYLDGLRIADKNGFFTHGVGIVPEKRISIADRDHFIRLRDDPNAGLVISKPLRGRVSGEWVIVLVRRLNLADGSFAGIASAVISLEQLTDTFSAIDVGRNGAVTLFDKELSICARYPEPGKPGSAVGQKCASPDLLKMVQAGQSNGTGLAIPDPDGIKRKFSFHRLPQHPFYIMVSLATDDYFAEWKERAVRTSTLVALFVLTSWLASWLIHLNWKRLKAASEKLAAEAEKFHTVADFTYDWEYWQGAKREIIYMTPSCERITGFIPADFTQDPELLYRIVHPEDRHLLDAILREFSSDKDATADFRIVRRDGEIRWISHACTVVFGNDGKFLGRRGSNRDITERRQIEDELKAANSYAENLILTANAMIVELDVAGNIRLFNPAAEEITGYAYSEVAGRNWFDLIVPKDRYPETWECFKKISSANLVRRFENPILTKAGTERQIIWQNSLVEEHGKFAGVVSFGIDITEQKDALKAMQLSEEKYKAVIETTDTGYFILDQQGKILDANREYIRLSGHARLEEILGRCPTEWTAEYDRERNLAEIQKCWKYGFVRLLNLDYIDAQEKTTPVEINATVVPLGNKSQIVALCRDVSEQKQLVRTLKESEDRFRNILDHTPIGMVIATLNGRYLRVNHAFCNIVGYDMKELEKMSFQEITHPEDLESDLANVLQLLEGQRSSFQMTKRYIRKDRQIVWVQLTASLLRNDKGEPLYFIAQAEDISERRNFESALRESEQRFRDILDHAPIGMSVVSLDGKFTRVNHALCKLFGYEMEELKKLSYQQITHPDDQDTSQADIQRIIDGEAPFLQIEKRYIRKDGQIVWGQVTYSVVMDANGAPHYLIAQIEDATERKNIQEQIRQLAYYDPLTALPNRRLLLDRLDLALGQAKRFQRSLAVIFLDLDNFKHINDSLGHDIGDELLKVGAQRLLSCVRSIDTVSRQGGDEFVIILAEISQPQDATLVAEKILRIISEPIKVCGHELHITTSIGIAVSPNGNDEAADLLKRADIAMYRVKDAGRNGFRFYQ